MLGKLIPGWIMITICYIVTYGASAFLYRLLFGQPIDHNWTASGIFMGSFLILVPYTFAGIYSARSFAQRATGAFWLSTVPVIAERCLVYLIGASLVSAGGDGSMDGITTMMFIRGEAAPYYSLTYILLGVVSILLTIMISKSTRPTATIAP